MADDISVSYIAEGKLVERTSPRRFASSAMGEHISAVRKPAFYKGQASLPGYFWMSTMDSLVMYESRLEMVVLLQLDFNPLVSTVISQPCVIYFSENAKRYRHTPDFFVKYTNDVGELINVKPKKFVNTDRNIRSFGACQNASVEMGFASSVRTEMEPIFLKNLWWLSGYRRQPPHTQAYGAYLIECASSGMSIDEILQGADCAALVRPVLFYMIWKGLLSVNLYEKLNGKTVTQLAANKDAA